MAMELEAKIMGEIGLAQHFNYFNGSGSCEYIRKDAANKLGEAISNNVASGEIASPNARVIGAVKRVAQIGDDSQDSLTKTWQAASEAIAAHIHAAGLEPEAQRKQLEDAAQFIEQQYLPEGRRSAPQGKVSRDIDVIGPMTARLARGNFDHGLGKLGLKDGDSSGGGGRSIG
jgi:hypothetical protein